jgi:uncharacterized membrane protein
VARNWHEEHVGTYTTGQRIADATARVLGSWAFIITQTVAVAAWVSLNVIAWVRHWDPYPFILLNLMFSVQAAYAAPLIMMSQNRAADRDRVQATSDYDVNLKAELEIQDLQADVHRCIALLEEIRSGRQDTAGA